MIAFSQLPFYINRSAFMKRWAPRLSVAGGDGRLITDAREFPSPDGLSKSRRVRYGCSWVNILFGQHAEANTELARRHYIIGA